MRLHDKIIIHTIYILFISFIAISLTDIIRKDTPYEYQQSTNHKFEEIYKRMNELEEKCTSLDANLTRLEARKKGRFLFRF